MQENTWLLTLGQNNKDTENGGPAIMSKEENEICFDFWKSAVLTYYLQFFSQFHQISYKRIVGFNIFYILQNATGIN